MADDVFVYIRDDLPAGVNELITPCAEGYTIYISSRLDQEHQLQAYEHALKHIDNGDFDIDSDRTVQEIESAAHGVLEKIIPAAEIKTEIKELKVRQRKLKAAQNRNAAKVKFLQQSGYDFFAAAEARWLDPD